MAKFKYIGNIDTVSYNGRICSRSRGTDTFVTFDAAEIELLRKSDNMFKEEAEAASPATTSSNAKVETKKDAPADDKGGKASKQ